MQENAMLFPAPGENYSSDILVLVTNTMHEGYWS